MKDAPPGRRLRRAILASLVGASLWLPSPAPAARDNIAPEAGTFEQRAEAEKRTRSRYRRLEIASLVVILVAGGAVILWAVRRK